MDNKFGAFLYELRKEKGLTQSELAAMFELTNKAVSKWETGETMPDVSLLAPLARLLGVSVDELLNGRREAGSPCSACGQTESGAGSQAQDATAENAATSEAAAAPSAAAGPLGTAAAVAPGPASTQGLGFFAQRRAEAQARGFWTSPPGGAQAQSGEQWTAGGGQMPDAQNPYGYPYGYTAPHPAAGSGAQGSFGYAPPSPTASHVNSASAEASAPAARSPSAAPRPEANPAAQAPKNPAKRKSHAWVPLVAIACAAVVFLCILIPVLALQNRDGNGGFSVDFGAVADKFEQEGYHVTGPETLLGTTSLLAIKADGQVEQIWIWLYSSKSMADAGWDTAGAYITELGASVTRHRDGLYVWYGTAGALAVFNGNATENPGQQQQPPPPAFSVDFSAVANVFEQAGYIVLGPETVFGVTTLTATTLGEQFSLSLYGSRLLADAGWEVAGEFINVFGAAATRHREGLYVWHGTAEALELFSGTADKNPGQQPQQPAPPPVSSPVFKNAGMYRVGTDIPAGEYLLITDKQTDSSTGYYAVTTTANARPGNEEFLYNGNFYYRKYIRVQDGQYLTFSSCKMYQISDWPAVNPDAESWGAGQYRVGVDLEPGEYKLTTPAGATLGGYYKLQRTPDGKIGTSDFITNRNFTNQVYVTLAPDTYVYFSRSTLTRAD